MNRLTLVLLLSLLILINVSSLKADGFLVIPEPIHINDPFPLEVKYHRVDVKIENQIAITEIDQVFYNPTTFRLEGYYIFPIPQGAVLNDFTMFINGKQTPAELLDANKARGIYEDIVRQMRDPALLEYSERGIFKARIFPIEPHSEKRVTLSYSEALSNDNGTFEYLYPLNTEKFSAAPLQDVSINVELKTNEAVKNIYCPTHEVEIVRKSATHFLVGYQEREVKPDLDFKLYYNIDPGKLGMTLLTYQKGKEDGFFFLNISPGYDYEDLEISDKDIVFVLDVSGSMAGKKLIQAKQALNYCVDNLNSGDRFDIIRFSTESYRLFKSLAVASKENRWEAYDFIDDLNSIGGTNIEEALLQALDYDIDPERPFIVVFITDGKPTIGERDEDKLVKKISAKNNDDVRIFTFGIGNEINTHLLDKITTETKATRTYISPDEDIEEKITSFYNKVQSPVLTDLSLSYGKTIETYQSYPGELPDLFKGSSLMLLGRFKGSGSSEIVLSGKINGKKVDYRYQGQFRKALEYDFIPPLWASRRIGYLLDVIRLNGESDELIEEITVLAKTHGIVTPYTSYLILEDEEQQITENAMEEDWAIAGSFSGDTQFRSKLADEFKGLSLKSGHRSNEVSLEFQQLNKAENLVDTRQGQERMYTESDEGRRSYSSQQVRNIQGRAFYQSGEFWVDSELQTQKPEKTIRIQFGSDEYFQLLKDQAAASQYLALGQNVRFLHAQIFYEIFE